MNLFVNQYAFCWAHKNSSEREKNEINDTDDAIQIYMFS